MGTVVTIGSLMDDGARLACPRCGCRDGVFHLDGILIRRKASGPATVEDGVLSSWVKSESGEEDFALPVSASMTCPDCGGKSTWHAFLSVD